MSGPLGPCGRAECRLCHPVPVEEHSDTLAELAIGAGMLVLWFAVVAFILPVLA